jgi:hypothetical protein
LGIPLTDSRLNSSKLRAKKPLAKLCVTLILYISMTLDAQLEKNRAPRGEAGDESCGVHTQLIIHDVADLDIKASGKLGMKVNYWEGPAVPG